MKKNVLVLAFLFLSSTASIAVAKDVTAANELKVGVKGMVCAFCAQGIEKNFKERPEIEKVHVSLENKFVTLTFKEGQRLSNKEITSILKEAGYDTDLEK